MRSDRSLEIEMPIAVSRVLIALLYAVPVVASGQPYRTSTVAGGVPPLGPLPALEVSVGYVIGVAADTTGNAYFTSSLRLVFKLDPRGTLTRVAGNGTAGFSGDGGPATSAQLNFPQGLAVDGSGNLYIADFANARIRKVAPDGVITTVAGGCCVSTNTVLSGPQVVAVDSSGALYIGDQGHILKVSPSGTVAILAAQVSPTGLAVDSAGNLFVAAEASFQVLEISPGGTVTTVAGNGKMGDSGDGGPAINATLGFLSGLALDSAGDLIIADGTIRTVTPDGNIHTIANATCCSSPNGGVHDLGGTIAVDAAGDIYAGVYFAAALRKVTSSGGVSDVAGTGSPSLRGRRRTCPPCPAIHPRSRGGGCFRQTLHCGLWELPHSEGVGRHHRDRRRKWRPGFLGRWWTGP